MVDKAADSSGDGSNLVKVTEEAKPASMYGSCNSKDPDHSSSSSSSDDDDDDDDDDDSDDDFFL